MKRNILFLVVCVVLPIQASGALTWTVKTSMPTERYDMCTGTVQDIIYVIGGGPGFVPVSTVEAYDPTADTVGGTPWTTKMNMLYPMHRLAAAVIHDTIYTCGGWYGMGVKPYTLEYCPFTDMWTQKSDMPAVRQYHTAASVGGRMYAIGGAGPVNTCFEYDQAGDSWSTKTAMPTSRYALAAAAVGGKIYVIGGDAGSGVVGTVEAYDPSADTAGGSPWSTKTSMPTPRRFLTCCVKADTIYAIGGVDDTKAYHNTVEKYVPATDSWFSETSMPTARRAPVSSVVNGIIYVIGGDNGSALDTNEAAEPATAIELTSFNAIGEKASVILTWSVAMEQGIAHWIIERSTDGPYETIAILEGKMQTPSQSHYRYFDDECYPMIQNLYRLGAQRADNTIKWYGPVSATPIPLGNLTMLIIPNPFKVCTEIRLAGISEYQSTGPSEIHIYDLSGRLVKTLSLASANSVLHTGVIWDGRDSVRGRVPPGVYFIKLVSSTGIVKEVKKVIIVK